MSRPIVWLTVWSGLVWPREAGKMTTLTLLIGAVMLFCSLPLNNHNWCWWDPTYIPHGVCLATLTVAMLIMS